MGDAPGLSDQQQRALDRLSAAEKVPVYPPGLDERQWATIKGFFLVEAPKLVANPTG
jgi:hypothetical protein